jgi:5-methylcytosine-specific restriction endonuclease McrA
VSASPPDDPRRRGPQLGPKASRVATPMTREPVAIAERALTPARRARILARDAHSCRYPGCGQTLGLEVDHIIALGLGGRDADDNLQTLCEAHHRQKTQADARRIAKAKRAGAKHRGAFPPSKAKIRGRGFAPTRDWTDDAD